MVWADRDRFATLQQQAVLILEASELEVASVVSIMAVATAKADM